MGILDDLSQATCRTCRWWSPATPNTAGSGDCLHRSPVGIHSPETGNYYALWPLTSATDRCGDHQFRGADA